MKVRVTRQARCDLEAIIDWIAEDNPVRALTFADELEARCHSLADHPQRFPVFATVDGVVVRKLSHRGYAIFYFVLEDAIEVTHIVHGARDLEVPFDDPA